MRSQTLRVRLTAWYLVVIFITLAVSSLAMYFGIQKAIEDTVDTQLQARSDNVRRFLEPLPSQQAAAEPQLLPATAGFEPGDELYQVTDASGAMLFQSPAMRELEVPLDTNQLHSHYRHHRDLGNFTTYYRRHRDVRVLASVVHLGDKTYRIQVAADINPLYAVLETFRKAAWTILPLIVCLAGFGGYWLTGRAMEPLHSLVRSTRGISERNLSERLPVPAPQDELQDLANTMNAMLDRLEAAFNRVTRFTSDASHELRTPVTVIRTTAEVILEKQRSPEEYQEMVREILRESEFTAELIEQLLTLARADAEREQLSLAPIDLRELVQEIDFGSRTLAKRQGISWSSEIPSQSVAVLGDGPHLRRLLLILIHNACRYTTADGKVRLTLEARNQEAILTITDTGIGIPPDELKHIFGRFYRATNARYFAPDGSGLGLSIAHWIALAHEGMLTAASTIGVGTSMRLVLPLSKASATHFSSSAMTEVS